MFCRIIISLCPTTTTKALPIFSQQIASHSYSCLLFSYQTKSIDYTKRVLYMCVRIIFLRDLMQAQLLCHIEADQISILTNFTLK